MAPAGWGCGTAGCGDRQGCGHVAGCKERGRYGGCYQSVVSASSPAAAISPLGPEAEAGSPLPGDASAAGPGPERSQLHPAAGLLPPELGARPALEPLGRNKAWAGVEGTLAQGNGRRVQPRGRGGAAPHWPLGLGSSAAPS